MRLRILLAISAITWTSPADAQVAHNCVLLASVLGDVPWARIHELEGEYTFIMTDTTDGRRPTGTFRVLLGMNDSVTRFPPSHVVPKGERPLQGWVFPARDSATIALGLNPRYATLSDRTLRLGPRRAGTPSPTDLNLTLDAASRGGFDGTWRHAGASARAGVYCAIRKPPLVDPDVAPDSLSETIIDVIMAGLVQHYASLVVAAADDTTTGAVAIEYPAWGDQAYWARRTNGFLALLGGRRRADGERNELVIRIEVPRVAGPRLDVMVHMGWAQYCNGKRFSTTTMYGLYAWAQLRGRWARPTMVPMVESLSIPECDAPEER